MDLVAYIAAAARNFPLGCRLDFAKREFYTRALNGPLVRGDREIGLVNQNVGAKSYYTAKIQLNRAAIGEPYVNHSGLYTPVGLNLEAAKTNYLLSSEDFTNTAVWQDALSGTGVASARTANYAIAPDGTLSADRIILDVAAGTLNGDVSGIGQIIAGLANPHSGTASFWMKSNTANTYAVRILDAGGSFPSSIVSVTPTWTRLPAVYAAQALTTANIRLELRGLGATSKYADFSVWGGQYELGSFASSYIPTTTASVARAADTCSLPSTFLSGIKDRGYLEVVHTVNAATSGTSRIFMAANSGADGPIFFISNAGKLQVSWNNAAFGPVAVQTWTPNVIYTDRFEWRGNVLTSYRDGSLLAGPTAMAAGMSTIGATAYIGNSAGSAQIDGSIKSLTAAPLP